MKNWTYYDSVTGRILGSVGGNEYERDNNQPEDSLIIEGEWDANIYYIDTETSQAVERTTIPHVVQGTTIINLPPNTKLVVDEGVYMVADGIAELSFEFPGTYLVHLKCFPYLPTVVKIVV